MAQKTMSENTPHYTPAHPPPAPGFTCPLKYFIHTPHKKSNRAAVSPGSPHAQAFMQVASLGRDPGNDVGLGPRKSGTGTRKAGPSRLN